MKIPLFILAILTFAFCKKPVPTSTNLEHQINTTYYATNLEVLNGKVKRIVEISKDAYLLKEATDFNLNGDIIRAQMKGGWNCLVKHTYKYNKEGKPSALVVSNGFRDGEYKFGNNGRISMRSFDTKLYDLHGPVQKKFFYKYDASGYLIQEDGYAGAEHQYSNKFKYNDKHLLTEMSSFYSEGGPEDKTTFIYLLVDKKGNWLKRITMHSDVSPGKADTITRKISYY